jgi:hypothetical protein
LAAAIALAVIHAANSGVNAAQEAKDSAATTQPTEVKAAGSDADEPSHVRVIEDKGKRIALEIASREFESPEGRGPKVCLVGVAHIADRSFYRAVEKLLGEYDVVLYESVKPAGTGGAGGDTDEQRVASTKAAMQFVGGLIESFKSKRDAYPENLAELRVFAVEREPRLGQWLDVAVMDGWGHPLVYTRSDDAASYTLVSFAADGAAGGDDAAADFGLADQHPPDPMAASHDDSLQSQLADALDLQFQLDAIDYSHDNWRCSDMAIDEVGREMAQRGLDFGPMGGTLAGTSFPARIIKMMLGLMRFADSLMDGAIADTFKVVMIEMLGDEQFIEKGLGQLGQGFTEVIVEQRNQVAVDDLRAIIDREPEVKSVAILYGAAHMDDLGQRLMQQLGYEPRESHWLKAIEVDLEESVVSARDISQVRRMMKQVMQAQQQR